MSVIDLKQIKIAKKYAEALLSIATDNGQVRDVFNELKSIETILIQSKDLTEFLSNPVISIADKLDVVNQIFNTNFSQTVINFLKLLVENSRFNIFNEVLSVYSDKLDELDNITKVKVVSAIEINDFIKARLIEKLEYKLSKKVVIDYRINPEIIAGLIIEVNDKTIDTSIKTKLNSIKKQLI